LASQKFAVLSTYGDGQPYANLVAFYEAQNLETIFFATKQFTRKYKNLQDHPHVALLIQNTANSEADIQRACVLTLTGTTEVVGENEKEDIVNGYVKKHPYLSDFVHLPDCILVKVRVNRLVWVENFETVFILDILS
jgi:general stress protein 26